MTNLNPSLENKYKVMDLLQKTNHVRAIMRKEAKSASEIIERFPRLLDYNGDMV